MIHTQTPAIHRLLLAATICSLAGGNAQLSAAPPAAADGLFKPEVESFKQYRCPEWFRDAKFGIWAVWGVGSVPKQGDWYGRHMYIQPDPAEPDTQWSKIYQYHIDHYGHQSKFGLKDLIPLWKAEKWDPDKLMALYKKAGAKYFFGLAVFSDNIDYWNSKYHRWNSVQMGPKRDIMSEWGKAARKQGLRFGVSEHWGDYGDWLKPCKGADKTGPLAGVPYDGNDPANADLYSTGPQPEKWLQRMTDLVDQCKPDLFYTDGGLPYPDQTGRQFLAHYYNQGRKWHNGKDEVVYNCKQESQGMWVEDLERGIMNDIRKDPWQTDTCIANWHYCEAYLTEHKYRSTTLILQMLADIVSKNGNLLLNFPPLPDGSLDEDELKILSELAAWMPVNGEAIFGTRPWSVFGEGPSKVKKGGGFNEDKLKYTARDIRFTTKGGALYALALGWPDDGKLVVKSLAKPAGKITGVSLLGHPAKLAWQQTDEGLVVTMPDQKPCAHVFALKIAGEQLKPAPLPPEPVIPPTVVVPGADGSVMLTGVSVQIEGNSPVYSKDGDQIGFWNTQSDYVFWSVALPQAGTYSVKMTYSCNVAVGNSQFTVESGAAKLDVTPKFTDSWGTYTTDAVGEITLTAGKQDLAIKPKPNTIWKSLGLRSIELKPTGH
jgi:alpha-L-fucosidase